MSDLNMVFEHPTNLTTFAQKLAFFDNLTSIDGQGGMLGIFMLIVIFGSLFMIMKLYKTESAFAVAGLITGVCGFLIRVFFPISDNVIYISLIIFVISLLYMLKEASNQEP